MVLYQHDQLFQRENNIRFPFMDTPPSSPELFSDSHNPLSEDEASLIRPFSFAQESGDVPTDALGSDVSDASDASEGSESSRSSMEAVNPFVQQTEMGLRYEDIDVSDIIPSMTPDLEVSSPLSINVDLPLSKYDGVELDSKILGPLFFIII